MMLHRFVAATLALLLAGPVFAQSPGNVNLVGPSTSPGAAQLTPAAINAAVNAALALKADATNGTITNPTFVGGAASSLSVTSGGTTNTLATWMSYLMGTSNPNPMVFGSTVSQVITTDDYAVVPPVYWNIKQATLSPSANTSQIWQNDNSYVYLNGPGQHNGEINLRHTNFSVALGAYATQVEDHEIQMGNFGTIVAWNGDLFLPTNQSTGIVTGAIYNTKHQLTNNNTTTGAIASYAAIDNEAMQGGGSQPTFNYLIRNADIHAAIATMGNMMIGSLSIPPSSTLFQVQGPDTSSGTVAISIRNSSGNIFTVDDGGNAVLPTVNKLGAYGSQNYFLLVGQGNGSAPSIQAVGNSDANISLNLKTTGTGVIQVNGANGVNCAAGTVSLATLVITAGLSTHC